MVIHTHTHTHPFNRLLSGTTQVNPYQKGKTKLGFTGARDSEWQWHQLGHIQICTSLQTDNRASTSPLSFYRPDALPAAQPTASKHWRHTLVIHVLRYSLAVEQWVLGIVQISVDWWVLWLIKNLSPLTGIPFWFTYICLCAVYLLCLCCEWCIAFSMCILCFTIPIVLPMWL